MKYKLLIYFSFIFTNTFAQHDCFVGGSLMGGTAFNKYSNNHNQLYSRRLLSNIGGSLFVQYRFFDRIGIEAGLIQNTQYLRMRDKAFADRNPGFQIKLSSNNAYWSYYGALSYTQPLDQYSKIYTTAGYCFNNSGDKTVSKSKTFVVNDEVTTLKSKHMNNASVYLEAGYETMLSDNVAFFAGIRFNKGLSNFTEAEYTAEKNGIILSNDQVVSKGTYLGINTGLKINVFHKDKKVKQPKPVHNNIPTPVKQDSTPKKLNGRSLSVSQKIVVKNATIRILVWDDQQVDGDRISLNLNGRWIVKNYTLEKEKKTFVVVVKPGENIFVLHALNLGKIKPNTAAIIIDDGITQQKMLLESDLESSGTLIIEYKMQ